MNLPRLFTSDGDKIKYAALNYATTMRHNLHLGVPIFTNIRTLEAEIERRRDTNSIVSERVSSADFTNNDSDSESDLHRDNATLALIMAKELAFLNRTIQMISLIARRYQEEQEDLEWGKTNYTDCGGDLEEGGISGSGSGEDTPEMEQFEDDSTSSPYPLQRSLSSPTTTTYDCGRRPKNQLVATFLVASGQLYGRFDNLCRVVQTSTVHVNAMTTQDKPHSEANRKKQLSAEGIVISDIYLNFERFDAEHRDPVVYAFLELCDISVSAWRILSMFAFSNLFRLAKGSEFAIYHPQDAIFSQGREYRMTVSQDTSVSAEYD